MGWNEQSDFVYCFEKWGAICVDPIVQDNGRIYCRSYEGEVVCLDLQPAHARPAQTRTLTACGPTPQGSFAPTRSCSKYREITCGCESLTVQWPATFAYWQRGRQ